MRRKGALANLHHIQPTPCGLGPSHAPLVVLNLGGMGALAPPGRGAWIQKGFSPEPSRMDTDFKLHPPRTSPGALSRPEKSHKGGRYQAPRKKGRETV